MQPSRVGGFETPEQEITGVSLVLMSLVAHLSTVSENVKLLNQSLDILF